MTWPTSSPPPDEGAGGRHWLSDAHDVVPLTSDEQSRHAAGQRSLVALLIQVLKPQDSRQPGGRHRAGRRGTSRGA